MTLLKEGDIIVLKPGHTVYAKIPEHFVYSNQIGNFELTKHEVVIAESYRGLDTMFMCGKWIVTKTFFHGGGTGHGPHDVFPDGHHVFCERVVGQKFDYKMEVDFYQTGCFSAMIPEDEIEVIGRAKANWEVDYEVTKTGKVK